MEGVKSTLPKLRPKTVTGETPEGAILAGAPSETTGPSYENNVPVLPKSEPTNKDSEAAVDVTTGVVKVKEVVEIQEVDIEAIVPTMTVEVKSAIPKFRPDNVSRSPPQRITFVILTAVITGASKVMAVVREP